MNELNVSVVVICFNEEDFIEECLASLASQDYPSNLFEVLIIENGSTDKTQEIVKSLNDLDIESPASEFSLSSSKNNLYFNPDFTVAEKVFFALDSVEVYIIASAGKTLAI